MRAEVGAGTSSKTGVIASVGLNGNIKKYALVCAGMRKPGEMMPQIFSHIPDLKADE